MTGSYSGGAGQERAGRRRADAAEATPLLRGHPPKAPAAAPPASGGLTVEEAASSVVRLANKTASVSAAHQKSARRDAETARKHAHAQSLQLQQQLREVAQQTQAKAVSEVVEAAGALAPGVLSSDWENVQPAEQPAGILDAASYVRVGDLRPAGGARGGPSAPLIVPLLDHGNLLIAAPGDNRAVDGVVQDVVLRSLLGTGAGQLSLAAYDPHLRGTTAPFSALRQVSDELVPPTLAAPDELRDLLDELSRDVRRISEMYEGVPTTLGEFRNDARQPIERYRLAAILNYPVGFDDHSHALLRTLMRTGPACGISFLLHHDTGAKTDALSPEDLYPHATILRLGSPNTVDGLDGFTVDAGTAPSLAVIEPAIDTLQERAKDAAAPKISFSELQPPPGEHWQESTAERLTAVIGRAGHQPVEITVGDEREQRHNILVSGAVGQGKSNLLMVMVHSWALRYSPTELELYLLDFKDGVTLYPLAPHSGQEGWLPHARVLGLESDRAYGAAVLQHLVNEFERRAAIIRPFGDNITRYRQQQPTKQMPRIVAVIDEFQVLFEEDDDLTRAALLNLERLAKKGRAYGIHLVLASQTLSGITAMLSKQDGIFAQFPIRLALKNSAGESRAVLDQQNTEAARLRYRGELIVNTDFGNFEGNRRSVVALAEPSELTNLRSALARRSAQLPRPAVFNGAAAPDLVATLSAARDHGDEPAARLGLPVAVMPKPVTIPLPAESGRHLSIVGAGDSPVADPDAPDDPDSGSARGHAAGAVLLQSAATSLAYQCVPGSARFIVLNLLAARSPDQAVVVRLQQAIEALGHKAETAGPERLIPTLSTLAEDISKRRAGAELAPVYVIAFGMDRAPNLRQLNPETFTQPIDALHTLWREGSQLGVHLLGWWANVRSYNDQLGMEANGTIDAMVLLRVSSQDVIDVLGPFVQWAGHSNRALVRDVAEASEPLVFIPFGALSEKDIEDLRAIRGHR